MSETTHPPSLRLATPEDAIGIREIYAPIVRDTSISFELEPPSVEEVAKRIRGTLEHYPWLVAADETMVLGYAYAGSHRSRAAYQWSCEVSVYIHDQAHRRGIATSLYAALLQLLKLQGFGTVFAGITQPNPKSVSLHRAMGFKVVGTFEKVGLKHGAWRDVEWWQQSLGPAAKKNVDRPAPLGLPEVLAQPELRLELDSILAGQEP